MYYSRKTFKVSRVDLESSLQATSQENYNIKILSYKYLFFEIRYWEIIYEATLLHYY